VSPIFDGDRNAAQAGAGQTMARVRSGRSTSRLSRRPPAGHDEKAFARAYRDVVGGPPLWVAAHLAQWGIPVRLYSAVGDDEAGRIVMSDLDRRGINTAGIVRPEGLRTATPVVIVDRTGERAIIIDALPEAALLRIGEGLKPKAGDWVVSNLFHLDPVRLRCREEGHWRRDLIDLELQRSSGWEFGRA
jgi:sugar/nucleoside kinase (ribokinase family)